MFENPLYSRLISGVYRRIWLGRVNTAHPKIPGGSIIMAAHYNGAVDGFTYGSQLPPFLAVISAQWHRTWIGKALLPGISVQRAKDGVDGAGNLGAFRRIVDHQRLGDRILFFPEGTSRLGTERLPVQRGTLLLLRMLRKGPNPPGVLFAAARYHDPTRWRSSVSVAWVGPVELPDSPDRDSDWISAGLLAAQSAAYSMPDPRPKKLAWLAPVLALPYLPVWMLASRLARRTADDTNVVALWTFIYGVPLTMVALACLLVAAAVIGWPLWLPVVSLTAGWILW
jgi:1-acyl-sn-glycerol-3-phosphate acyltransferase